MTTLSYTAGLGLSIAAIGFHVIGAAVTTFRLWYRRRRIQRLWWDDYIAGLALVVDFVYVPMVWFGYGSTNSMLYNTTFLAVKFRIQIISFTMIIWLGRISLVLAIARIFPPGEPTRRLCIVAAYIFLLCFLSIILQFAIECPWNLKMIYTGRLDAKKCSVKQSLGLKLSFLILELTSGVFLLATPLYKLWRVRLPTEQRRLVLTGFATSILTTLTSVICVVFLFLPNVDESIITEITFLEAAVAIIDCNLLVIITYIHTRRRRGEEMHRTIPPETCSDNSNGEYDSHSNHVPNSSALTTLSLTQITVSYDDVDSERNPQTQDSVLSFDDITPASTQNSGNVHKSQGGRTKARLVRA